MHVPTLLTARSGRGISLVTDPASIPANEAAVVCEYITNPLLVDGFKFDLRLYVAVTSFDPLRAYLYEDGLARFATAKFDMAAERLANRFVHLTNYSVNKKSARFVASVDPDVEDYGNKWSLSALLQHLRAGGVDTAAVLARIEALVVRTLVAGQGPVAAAQRTFSPHAGISFELFGFDVLLDAELKPWLLEVNLSPSLATDTPLDLKIKSHVVADLLSLALLPARSAAAELELRRQTRRAHVPLRPTTAGKGEYTADEQAVLRCDKRGVACDDWRRRTVLEHHVALQGGFMRIYPVAESAAQHGALLDSRAALDGRIHAALLATAAAAARCSVPMCASPGTTHRRSCPLPRAATATTARCRAAWRWHTRWRGPCLPPRPPSSPTTCQPCVQGRCAAPSAPIWRCCAPACGPRHCSPTPPPSPPRPSSSTSSHAFSSVLPPICRTRRRSASSCPPATCPPCSWPWPRSSAHSRRCTTRRRGDYARSRRVQQ